MQFPQFPRYLVPPRSKYSPQHQILKYPQLPFLPQCQRPSFTPIRIILLFINVCCACDGTSCLQYSPDHYNSIFIFSGKTISYTKQYSSLFCRLITHQKLSDLEPRLKNPVAVFGKYANFSIYCFSSEF